MKAKDKTGVFESRAEKVSGKWERNVWRWARDPASKAGLFRELPLVPETGSRLGLRNRGEAQG